MSQKPIQSLTKIHRFLDEAGDTTFFSKGGLLALGTPGVSLSFIMGMVEIRGDLKQIREEVVRLQRDIMEDDLLNVLPSVAKKIQRGGFHFHATDDPPEVREKFVRFLKKLDCSADVMVARKLPDLFDRKHNSRGTEFYADILSHLIRPNLGQACVLVLNVAERGTSTRNTNLQQALEKATAHPGSKKPAPEAPCRVLFNVQTPKTEPLLTVADYLCWSIQRVFERGETRFYDYLRERFRSVVDIFAPGPAGIEYSATHPLTTQNKLSPPTA